jgi:hypothetical protein
MWVVGGRLALGVLRPVENPPHPPWVKRSSAPTDGEHLVLQRAQLHPQEVAHHLRRVQDFAVAYLSCEYTLRSLQHLVGVGRTVVVHNIANEKGRIERMSKLRHDGAPVRIGRNCLEQQDHLTHSTVLTASGVRRPNEPEASGINAEWP